MTHNQKKVIAEYKLNPKTPEIKELIDVAAYSPDGSLWLGSYTGLFHKKPNDKVFTKLTQDNGLNGKEVLGIVNYTDKQLVIGTDSSLDLLSFDEQQYQIDKIANLNIGQGNLLLSEDLKVWNDVVRVDPRTSEITTLSDADGIDLGSAWLGSYKKLSSGHFLFGGSDGLVIVNPKEFSPWQFTSSAYISQITVNGKHRDLPTDHPVILVPMITQSPNQ